MLPDKFGFSHLKSFFSQEDVNLLINNLPKEDDWFQLHLIDSSRKQSNVIKESPSQTSTFKLIRSKLETINLALTTPMFTMRIYSVGDYVDWHVDYKNNPQDHLECIIVLKNTSDQKTLFKIDNEIMDCYTEAGDVLLVCHSGVEHSVTSPTFGERVTIKVTCHKIN